MQSKQYAIVFNPYPDAGSGDGYESIMIVMGMTANDALSWFMTNTTGKYYVPLKIAVVGEPYGITALKVVNERQYTTVKYEVA